MIVRPPEVVFVNLANILLDKKQLIGENCNIYERVEQRDLYGVRVSVLFFLYWLIIQNLCCSAHAFPSENSMLKINKLDNNKEVTVKVGDAINIELELFGGTGYDWHIDKPSGECLELISERTDTAATDKAIVGAPLTKEWELRAIKRGDTEVVLHLYRAWEGKEKAIDLFKIRVKIL